MCAARTLYWHSHILKIRMCVITMSPERTPMDVSFGVHTSILWGAPDKKNIHKCKIIHIFILWFIFLHKIFTATCHCLFNIFLLHWFIVLHEIAIAVCHHPWKLTAWIFCEPNKIVCICFASLLSELLFLAFPLSDRFQCYIYRNNAVYIFHICEHFAMEKYGYRHLKFCKIFHCNYGFWARSLFFATYWNSIFST